MTPIAERQPREGKSRFYLLRNPQARRGGGGGYYASARGIWEVLRAAAKELKLGCEAVGKPDQMRGFQLYRVFEILPLCGREIHVIARSPDDALVGAAPYWGAVVEEVR